MPLQINAMERKIGETSVWVLDLVEKYGHPQLTCPTSIPMMTAKLHRQVSI